MSRLPTPKPGILDIALYVPGKSKAAGFEAPIKLSSNENPLGCSPMAKAAFVAAADRLSLYPDGHAGVLRDTVAKTYGLQPERLIFGCGSDEVFEDLCQVYLEPGDNIVQGRHGFLAYAVFAQACQGEIRYADQPALRNTPDAILAAVNARTKIVFLDNPCNPTGTIMSGPEIAQLRAALPSDIILVLDGAYGEFADDPGFDDGLELARGAENIVVTKTFSKLHGLAAARVGWGYGPPAVIDAMDRIRQPFNLTIPGMEAAVAALSDVEFQHASVALVRTGRAWLGGQLSALGLEIVPSQANFILARFTDPERSASAAEAFLAGRGIIVRGVAAYGLPDYLRISIGTPDQNAKVAEALAAFIGRNS